jgi:hypothetical protein
MTRKDDILSNVLKHEMLKDKYHLSQKAMPKTIKEALSSSNPIIKSIALLIDNLENTTPTSDTVLRNIITQYLNESAL